MKPLILDFCISRSEDIKPCYSYDNELNLNILKLNDLKVPFVESDVNNLELQTKTEVLRESDDVELINFIELATKTFVERETDEDEKNTLLELETKTKMERERDD